MKKICNILIITLLIIERFFLNDDLSLTKFMELQLVVMWSIAQYKSYKKFGLFSLYSLCSVGFFIFAIGAIFHFLVSGDDIRYLEGRGFGDFMFTYRTIQEALWAYSVFIVLSYITYSYLLNKRTNKSGFKIRLHKNLYYFKIGKILMWSFLCIQVYKGYLYFNAFNDNRLALFLLGSIGSTVPVWVKFMASIFEYGYFFILASIPDEKQFKKYTLLYFVVLVPEILVGNRCMFGAFILFYLWYSYTFYGKTVKIRTAVIMGVVMLVVFQLIGFMRDNVLDGSASISLTRFLVEQGVSFYILPLYIDYVDNLQYYLYPFFLYNILNGFTGYTGQSIDVLQHNCGVGHQLMYTVNPDYYLAGASFGSSSIVEIYDTGSVGFVILSILFSYMLVFFEKRFVTSRFICFACFMIFSHFVLSPRGSFFPSLYGFVKLFIFYKLILFIRRYFVSKKNPLNTQ